MNCGWPFAAVCSLAPARLSVVPLYCDASARNMAAAADYAIAAQDSQEQKQAQQQQQQQLETPPSNSC
jgi:hypothetical protein